MAQEDLIPLNERTIEEQKEIARKGGIKSGEVRREKKLLKEYLEAILSIKDDKGIDKSTKIVIALVDRAEIGDTKAFEVIRDTLGQKPKDEIKATVSYEDRLKQAEDDEEY